MRDIEQDALSAYEDALERCRVLREAWEEEGKPVMATGGATGRAPVVHPLYKAMNEAENVADKLRTRLRQKHAGPEPSAVVTSMNKPRITKKAS